MPRLVACLPCYNEARALPDLLVRLAGVVLPAGWRLEVLVVDDGSADGTARIASEAAGMGMRLKRHVANLGLGRSLADGLAEFLGACAPGDALAVLDADLTHPPELLPAMLAEMERQAADVVIASRYAPGGEEHGLPMFRLVCSRLANTMLRLLAHIPGVRDYTCGYRLYQAGILGRAAQTYGPALIEEAGFVCMAELLIKLASCGARCAEVGLRLDYGRKAGPSKMNVPDTIRRYARLGWRLVSDPRLIRRGGGAA